MSNQKLHATVLFAGLVCTLLSVNNASAATSEEMVQALGIPPELVVAHNLYTVTGTGSSSVELSGEGAALALSDEGAVLISSGLGSDEGLGDTDWGTDGERDVTVFSVTLSVPTDARSLVFRTRFSSREYLESNSLDSAIVSIAVEPCDGAGCVSMPYDLVSVSEAVDTVNPTLLRVINTASASQLQVTFQILDADDGALDSAIRILDFHFSENPPPSPAQFNSELPPEDVKASVGTYRYQKTLFSVPGNGLPFELTLYYNAAQTWSKTFGRKWSHNYQWRLARLQDGGIHIRAGDGGSIHFAPPEAGTLDHWVIGGSFGLAAASFQSTWSGFSGSVVRNGNGTYTYTDRLQGRYQFSSAGLLTAIQDTNGNQLTVTHNHRDNVASVTDTRGNRAEFYYINDGRQLVSLIYERANRQFTFTYYAPVVNEAGEVQWDLFYFDEPGIGRTTFTYDERGNLLTATDPDGNVIVDNRYAGEIVVESADGNGATDAYRYFSDSVEHTDRLGRIHLSIYDNQDRMRAKTDPLGNTWRYSYDADGNVLSLADPLNNLERRTYDERANRLTLTDAFENTTSYEYDERNNLTRVTDPLGQSMIYAYDIANNLTVETDANGDSIFYTRTLAGQVEALTDRNGNVRSYAYSDAGEVMSQTDPLGHTTEYSYDDLGNLVERVDANGHVMNFVYDRADRLIGVRDPLGNETTYTLNALGQKTSVTRANDTITTYGYNANGRMTSHTDALGNSFLSSFNAVGRLETQTDPLGRVTRFSYDDADRQIGVVDALGHSATSGYDPAGRRTSVTGPGGGTARYEYDARGLIVAETDELGNTVRIEYDPRGLTTGVITGRGRRVTYSFDAAGRLVQMDFPDFSVIHTLDANGNAIQTVGQDGATIIREIDGLNRLLSRTDPNGRTLGYEYDAAGNLTQLVYSDGKTVSYAYDAADRLVEVTDWAGRRTTYARDAVGNLLSTTLPDGSIVTKAYDAADRVVSHASTTAAGETVIEGNYEYNGAGLRIASDVRYPLDPTTVTTPAELTYDAANQIASMNGEAFAYDSDGNLTAGIVDESPIALEYDDRNWLLRAGDDYYRYDDEGSRTGATIGGEVFEYTQDTRTPVSRLLEEHDIDGNVIARYVYGVGLISRESANGDLSIYHYDTRGSTVALTNIAGVVTDRYAYDPWGRVTGRTGTTKNPFTYNGRDGVMDDGNGLYYMRARYYSPLLMRFLERDPAFRGSLLHTQSLNRYSYVGGNPVQGTDPSGLVCAPCLGAIAGVTYQIAIDAYSGEFDVTDFDSYGPYFRDNWVDLSASAITGAAVFWNGPVYLGKLAWFLTAPILEDKVFDYFDTNWTEIAGDTIVDFAGDTYDWTCQNTSTSACDWVEGAIDDIGDTAEDISDVISDVWHSIL